MIYQLNGKMLARELENRVNFMRHTQAHSSLSFMKQTDELLKRRGESEELNGFSIPFGDESAELLLALNLALGLRCKVDIKNVVLNALSLMRSNRVVMGNPKIDNIINPPVRRARPDGPRSERGPTPDS